MSTYSGPGDPGAPAAVGARIGRFRILEQLGQGGMGVVYRAMEENLGREVALKVIAPLFAHDPEFRERFTREARAQASLESAHVVAVYAHGEEDGYLYIASQLIPGGDLGQMIRSQGVPSLVEALEIIEQVTSGLADAHDAGLVHRDIKPGNVLVRRRPGSVRAYLADFGIARRMNADATRFSSSTAGTPSYMAPELHGGARASAVSDLYALGCLLWVTLTGRPPYRGDSEYQLIAAHVRDPVPQLAGTSPMVNATNRILRTAMAKDPAERYQRAGEMSADLQAALRLPVTPGAAQPEERGATALRPAPRPVAPTSPTPPTPAPTPAPATTMPPPPPPAPTPLPFAAAASPPRRTGPGVRTWILLTVLAVLVAAGIGVAVALLTRDGGTGGSDDGFLDQPAKDIVRASEKDMAVVETARIRGEFADGEDTVEVDVVSTTRGDCKGKLTSTTSGGSADVLHVGDTTWLRADAKFWDGVVGAGTAAFVLPLIGDKWVVDDSMADSTEAFCDLDELLERDGREDAVAKNLGTTTVGGEKGVRIEQTEGTEREVLTIRVAEPHYVLRIDESEVDHFEFSEIDKDATIEAPDPDLILDLDKLLASLPGGTG
ncbi:serine/threonine-protein kinase [Nocardioides sp. QY071]|uniref:serine/threonine-protein kinase n=1 Tax=Nocardioides sp. QY071 TaxID=3044187 RepID=UPI00249ACC2F|nr:serine/threonine-protein kinase [Nocardioides sp. QY071]WGY02451.1 serine/threonine-protein kinase [Nocardioides sp. QY071]